MAASELKKEREGGERERRERRGRERREKRGEKGKGKRERRETLKTRERGEGERETVKSLAGSQMNYCNKLIGNTGIVLPLFMVT